MSKKAPSVKIEQIHDSNNPDIKGWRIVVDKIEIAVCNNEIDAEKLGDAVETIISQIYIDGKRDGLSEASKFVKERIKVAYEEYQEERKRNPKGGSIEHGQFQQASQILIKLEMLILSTKPS